jgi:Acetyltransferase (GNAT) domain
VTVTTTADAADTAGWAPVGAIVARPSHATIETAYGRRALASLYGELETLAVECDAPLTARPGWSLAMSDASPMLRPWAVLARDAAGLLVGAAVLLDYIHDPRAVLTTLAGTDGGHRGAILTTDPTVARALGGAVRWAANESSSHATLVLGPLPASSAVVHAFTAGMSGARADITAALPVIRREAACAADPYLSSGMTRTLRKAANRLDADGMIADIRFTTDAAEIHGLLPRLEQVYRHRDHMHGRISSLDDDVRHQAWRHRVWNLTDVGLLELAMLEIDGQLAAYTLGVVDGSAYRLLEGRFVTAFARYSPGRLLEAAVVDHVLTNDTLTTFDWMTAVAPESLLGQNGSDPMVLVQLG